MAEFFTSDLHFRHKNILNFEKRPYDTVDEMNAKLIEIWNKTVGKNDTVYNLGDFCFGGYDEWVKILEQLNGKITHIKGNHDAQNTLKQLWMNGYLNKIHMVGHYMKINKNILHLTHYPLDIGNRPRMFSLHGHIHNHSSEKLNQINLCIDSPVDFNREFGAPIPMEALIEHIEKINPLIEKAFTQERGI